MTRLMLQCKITLHATTSETENKGKVLAAKSFTTVAKLFMAKWNMLDNIHEAELPPITAFALKTFKTFFFIFHVTTVQESLAKVVKLLAAKAFPFPIQIWLSVKQDTEIFSGVSRGVGGGPPRVAPSRGWHSNGMWLNLQRTLEGGKGGSGDETIAKKSSLFQRTITKKVVSF